MRFCLQYIDLSIVMYVLPAVVCMRARAYMKDSETESTIKQDSGVWRVGLPSRVQINHRMNF